MKLPRYKLGLYDPCDDSRPVEFIGRVYVGNLAGIRDMREVIQEFNRLTQTDKEVTLCLAAFEVPAPERKARKPRAKKGGDA